MAAPPPSRGRSVTRALRVLILLLPLFLILRVGWAATRGARRSPLRAGPPAAEFVSDARFRDAYAMEVDAPPAAVWATLHEIDWLDAPLVGSALWLRDIPVRVLKRSGAAGFRGKGPRHHPATLDSLVAWGALVRLRERPGEAVVLGSVSRAWQADYGRIAVHPDSFRTFTVPGYVRTAWSLEVLARADGGSRLLLEWRTAATDRSAERRFLAYRAVVGPVARILARSTLPWIAREAERRAAVLSP